MRITTEMLLHPDHGPGVPQGVLAEVTSELLEDYLGRLTSASFVVLPFYDVPEKIRDIFGWNGGDEDWFVITRTEPEEPIPDWLERTGIDGDLDTYVLDGVIVYVGSHA